MVLGIYNFGSYIPLLGDLGMMPFSVCDTCFLLALERLERKNTINIATFFSGQKDRDLFSINVFKLSLQQGSKVAVAFPVKAVLSVRKHLT